MQIPFIKCHGSGNDFLLINHQDLAIIPQQQYADLAIQASDRNGLIGSDGILISAPSEKFDGRMIMYNSDGSEAEMCGNGMRCVARWFFENASNGQQQIEIETKVGSVICYAVPDLSQGVKTVSLKVGPAQTENHQVPIEYAINPVYEVPILALDDTATFTAVSIPNPHLISFVEEIDRSRLEHWGKQIEKHPEIFPNGMNVSMVRVDGAQKLFIMTNERGCGITKACGTAISSTAYVSCWLGYCEYQRPIEIHSEGGFSLCQVKQEDQSRVRLTGNATFTSEGILTWDEEHRKLTNVQVIHQRQDEVQAYETMINESHV